MISSRTKNATSRILPFGIIWFVSAIVYTLVERGILGGLNYYPSTGNPYDFKSNLVITSVMALIVGLFLGTVEVLYLSALFSKRSFIQKILVKILIYFAMIVAFIFSLSVIANAIQLNVSLTHRMAWMNAWLFFSTFSFWGVGIFVAYGMTVTLFFAEVSGNLGAGVLNNFFVGKYHKPIEEERIFMFLDMKSSTTIAEAMGHVKYFEMLKEYFADLTEPIIDYGGEIYQYVGDEIVITWKVTKGTPLNNCVACFFAMKSKMKKLESKYIQKFGLLPDFKAGIHTGGVTTGEIGVLKKEIIFTGDVLNTTARVQSLCNTYQLDLLISGQLLKLLQLNSLPTIQAIGETELRGRDEKIMLYTFENIV